MLVRTACSDVGRTDRTVWWMLFDLYQVSGRQDDFDNVAIDYASQFETSPPTWAPPLPAGKDERTLPASRRPKSFAGVLDAQVAPRWNACCRWPTHPVLRLEFGRIKDVTPEGCALLLDTLNQLHKAERELIVAGASRTGGAGARPSPSARATPARRPGCCCWPCCK
jgi:hypothetical protein